MEKIVIKRKEFSVLEQLGHRSYKVERKGKLFFLKKFENNKDEFFVFMKAAKRFSITAIATPKIYLYDKNNYIVVMQFIDAQNVLDILIKQDLPEAIIEQVFLTNYYAKFEKIVLNQYPDQYRYDGKKLYYLPFEFREYSGKDSFATEGVKYWFYTKELVEYLKTKELPYDENRIGNEYERNKEMALMAVKYYA